MCTPALCRLGMRDRVVRRGSGASRASSGPGGTRRRSSRVGSRATSTRTRSTRCHAAVRAEACGAEHLDRAPRGCCRARSNVTTKTVFDPELGLARPDGYFSGPRDCMTGRSTVFANTMIALLGRLLDRADGLPRPLAGYDVAGVMRAQFWTATPSATRCAARFRRATRTSGPSSLESSTTARCGDAPSTCWRRTASPSRFRCATSHGGCPRRSCRCPDVHAELPGRSELDELAPVYLHLLKKVDRRGWSKPRRHGGADRTRPQLLEIYTRPAGATAAGAFSITPTKA